VREATVEMLAVLLLDARLRPIRTEVLATGGLAAVVVGPREVFGSAIKASASALVIGHNHPSGDCSPSPDDIVFTRSMVAAGELLQVEVLDHLIVSRRAFRSLREHHSWGTARAA
jgi:DNA repair protein RadC